MAASTMKRILLIAALIWFAAWSINGQDETDEALQAAAEAYLQGEYEGAINIYEGLVSTGFDNSAVLFNLGNAYYETGQLGYALLNYRRALRKAPRDSDLALNITRIYNERIDFFPDEAGWLERLATMTDRLLTLRELSWLAFGAWAGWFGLLIWWLFRERESSFMRLLVGVGIVMVLGLILLTTRLYVESERPLAVVVVPSVQIMSGPGDDYLELYTLFAAAELRILREREGWIRFSLPDGRQGWVEETAIELV